MTRTATLRRWASCAHSSVLRGCTLRCCSYSRPLSGGWLPTRRAVALGPGRSGCAWQLPSWRSRLPRSPSSSSPSRARTASSRTPGHVPRTCRPERTTPARYGARARWCCCLWASACSPRPSDWVVAPVHRATGAWPTSLWCTAAHPRPLCAFCGQNARRVDRRSHIRGLAGKRGSGEQEVAAAGVGAQARVTLVP